MLPADHDGVTATATSEQKNVYPHAFLRAERPTRIELLDVLFGPGREAFALLALRVLYCIGRINRDVLRRLRPPEKAPHCVEIVACLCWSVGAAIPAGDNRCLIDGSIGVVPGRLDDGLEMIFTIPACCWR